MTKTGSDTLSKVDSLRIALTQLIIATQNEKHLHPWTEKSLKEARKVLRDTE